MAVLPIRPATECRWALVALGEVMLRLDPGDVRIATTRSFRTWEGGGEYNVARALKRCFGLETAVVTSLADNAVGRLIQDLIYQGGVAQSHLRWVPYDGVGRSVRNGLNFTERGFGVRAPLGCADRGHTAVSQLRPGEIDWSEIFQREGARWFHTGGIFAALSETTALVASEAMRAARSAGTVVSYDLNYRESLWKAGGGRTRAQEVNSELVGLADLVVGNEEDYAAALGLPLAAAEGDYSELDPAAYERMLGEVTGRYPGLRVAAVTLRRALSATRNDWSAICVAGGQAHRSTLRRELEILDRVGGGDGFASGLIYGLLTGEAAGEALELGAAHGALAMTTPGDTSMATLEEVRRVASGGAVRIQR
jgi:2-dehydro-3-deoxygluconokinase